MKKYLVLLYIIGFFYLIAALISWSLNPFDFVCCIGSKVCLGIGTGLEIETLIFFVISDLSKICNGK